jgi:predicted acylesterase/phospholipase RssA
MSKALVISGGGAKGAFAVGALKRLSRNSANLDFRAIAGTSIGAVITPFVVIKEIDLLETLFTTLKTTKVVQRLNRLGRMFSKGYVYDSEALRDRLDENLSPAMVQQILKHPRTTAFFATVCFQTGRVAHFCAGRPPRKPPASASYDLLRIRTRRQLIDAILASANMPVLMGPVIARGKRQYVDGGVRAYAPFEVAIDQGVDHVSAILHKTAPRNRPVSTEQYRRLDKVAERTVGLLTDDVGDNDLQLAKLRMAAKGITSRILHPPEDIEKKFGIKALQFTPAKMRQLVDWGELVATNKGW